ncbi:MAG: AarF/UbiB family protein [Candidatus Omnitrophica bacterium]|nr:AarF/UbiB family protein [Candidatus Omnitrophota bacterium]
MKQSKTFKILSILLCISLLLQQTGFAQVANAELNIAGHLQNLHSNIFIEKFRPLHLRSLSYDSLTNNFKLLLDKGDQFKQLQGQSPTGTVPELQSITQGLLNYFFIGLALPNDTFWVNLRPDSPNDIIDPLLAQTEVGKILLEADLELKKDTADATNPSTPQGKDYWNKLYTRAQELYGTQNVTIPTLTRPWIVPDEIIIRESIDSAYVYKATLKVMLEQDYLKDNTTYSFKDDREKQLNEYSAQLLREEIIPNLIKQINNAKRYAPLRQVYYSLILAQWFKARFMSLEQGQTHSVSLRGAAKQQVGDEAISNLINSKNLTNLKSKIPYSVATYFNAYKENFTKGQYNLQEPITTPYGQTIRSYFSGGISSLMSSPQLSEELTRQMGAAGNSSVIPVAQPLTMGNHDLGVKVDSDDTVQIEAQGAGESTPSTTSAVAQTTGVFPNSTDQTQIRGMGPLKDKTQEEIRELVDSGQATVVEQGGQLFAVPRIAGGDGRQDEIRAKTLKTTKAKREKVGKTIPGIPLKSQNEYNRDVDLKEKFLKKQDMVDRFIAPGFEGFEKFQQLYNEVRSVIDRLLIAQGLNPQEFQFFLADTVSPNAYVVNYYNAIVVNLGLIRMLTEYSRANNIDVTQDALAWVLSHEILHIVQNRREIDEGRVDEKKGLVDRHAEDRGKEYQSDLLALWLMDRGGFSVRSAPHVLAGIDHWLRARGERDTVWGTHPQIEERLRKLEHQILTYHWQNQDVPATTLNSVSIVQQRTRFREFQEQVINVTSASGLISLLNQARSIEELHFAMLIGFEVLPDVEKLSQSQVQIVFEQRTREFAGEDDARKVLFEYMKNEIYVMLGWMTEPSLDTFRRLGEQLSVETILRIYELGVPNIFSLSINVDKLQENKRHEQGEAVLSRLRHAVYSLNGQSRASDRFKMYASGFLYGLYTRMINDAKQGTLSLEQARRFLTDLVNMQESQGFFEGYLFTTPLNGMANALSSSRVYRSQMQPEDIQLLLRVYEILGTKVNYVLHADALAKSLYELAQEVPSDAKKELMDWLLRRSDGWNSLRAEFIKLDIKAVFEKGQSIVFQGSRMEYLENLLANENIVRNMQDVLKLFIEAVHKKTNNISAEDLVVMHQKVFLKLKQEHINDDLGIFRDLWFMARENTQMFAGDVFERVLSENIPTELRSLLERTRRELRPVFYIIALGAIPSGEDLRDFIFGALQVREREDDDFFSNVQIKQMINSLPVRRGTPNEVLTSVEERYQSLEPEDRPRVHELWNRINPKRRIENVNDNEFGLIKALLEHYRKSIGQVLSEKDSTPEQQEEAFGKYAAPFYLQALFVELGYGIRLKEDDVRFGSSAWQVFAGDIARKGVLEESDYEKLAAKQRPRNAVRFMKEEVSFDDFMRLFDFIALLPANYEEAVDTVVRGIPPSVFRNFVLHVLFVNRVLINQTGYTGDNNAIFDIKRMEKHIAGLSAVERANVLSAIAAIMPHFVHDEVMEESNKITVAAYWRDRYSKNAPKLDEAAIRRDHDQEIGNYNDMMYSVPGGPVAQLYIFVSRLADSEIQAAVESVELSLAAKREIIEKYYFQSSSARDRWIKAAIQSEGRNKSVEEIEKLLGMINSRELRDNLALSAFDQYRTEHSEEFGNLSDVLEKIKRFFPEASLIRDDVLSETAQFLAKTPEQYEKVRALYLDPFKKTKDLDLKETARTAMNADAFRAWTKNRSPAEKSHFLLWLMGITDEKPFFLVDFEYNFHVNADSMREDFGRRQSKYYPLAGQSSQREALEPFLYGEKGIFNDSKAMSNLLEGMFNFLIKDGPNKSILKKVFDKVFEKADQSRREEIFMALVWTLSLQRGELSNQQNIELDRQEARAVRMFLESLGLVGRQLAQVLARSLWVTQIMRDELSLVQDSAARMDKGVVFDMLEKFGLSGQFESIEEPLGSAKIAGVYRAKMRDGRVVAIKVKRAEVDKTIEADMKFLRDVFDGDLRLAFMAEGIVIPDNFITQIEEGFRQELDFEHEAKNTAELGARVQRTVFKKIKEFSLRKLFGDTKLGEVHGDYEFYVPQIIEVINNSAIVMEYIEGIKLSNEARMAESGFDQKDIELAVANELLREIFYEGFYHGDPHLGNILVQKGKNGRVRIVLIDAGASFGLNKSNRQLLGKLMVAVRDGQKDVLEDIVQRLGGVLNEDIRSELTKQVLEANISVGQKLLWFFHILEKNRIVIPNELLNIMRFFATGQALFDHGNSNSLTTRETQEDFVQADQLNNAINQGQDENSASSSTVGQAPGADSSPQITPPSFGSTGEYEVMQSVILDAYTKLTSGQITARRAASMIINALMNLTEPEYIVNLQTAIDILRQAGDSKFAPIIKILESYVGKTDHAGLEVEIKLTAGTRVYHKSINKAGKITSYRDDMISILFDGEKKPRNFDKKYLLPNLEIILSVTSSPDDDLVLVDALISDDAKLVDKALAQIDKLGIPRQVHQIVEKALSLRGLRLEIRDDLYLAIQVIDEKGNVVGELGLNTGADESGNPLLTIPVNSLYSNELRGKRIFPLLYRWMVTEPEFISRFGGWKFQINTTTESAAKSWQRSGLSEVRIIPYGDGYYKVEGKFPDWKNSHLISSEKDGANNLIVDSSSATELIVESGSAPGGIDFRFLPIVTQSMDSLKAGIRNMPQSTLQRINLTQEWSDIERLVNSGITPSTERLKEYLAASCFKGNLDKQDTQRILSCISEILRMQEETCCLTDPTLKDILVVLGSGRSGEELRVVFRR